MVFRKSIPIVALLFICILATPASAFQSAADLDQYLEDSVSKLGIPGLTIAIGQDGEIIYSRTFGEGVTNETQFYIGSISKSFTALAIMQLVEQGLIDIDKSVSTYIPEFNLSNEITLRQLLNHTSGMTEFDYMSKLPANAGYAELIEDINKSSLTYPPGQQFSYFNPNYGILGYIIERVSGQTYSNYLEQNIILPLGLNHTSSTGIVDVPGHLSFFGLSIKYREPFVNHDLPAGYLTSTAEDLVLYLEALRMRQPSVGVSSQGIDEMMTGTPFYGLGWMTFDLGNRPAVHHGGSLPGYTANSIMLTEDGLSIAFIVNKNSLVNSLLFYPELTDGIISIVTGQRMPLSRINYHWVYRILIFAFALTIIAGIRKLILKANYPGNKTYRARLAAALFNLGIPIVLYFVIPIAVTTVIQRGTTWKLAFLLAPDLVIWLIILIPVFHWIEAGIHFFHLARENRKVSFKKY